MPAIRTVELGLVRGFRRTGVLVAGACALAATAVVAQTVEIPLACPDLSPGPARAVARTIDGETLGLDDGTELRLIGALAPRAIDAGAEVGTWPAEAKTREVLGALVLGKSIELGFGDERTDRYGRLQAHAFLVEADRRRWVQGLLLEQGLARAYTLAGNRACGAEVLAAERTARQARRGLWADAAYQIRAPDRPSELLRHRTTFQIVEGRIVRVAQVRGVIYLNFDRDWRQGFAVSLRRDDRNLLGDYAGNPTGLEGRSVRVRGWIEQRGRSAIIDLSFAGQIEVVGGADGQHDQVR